MQSFMSIYFFVFNIQTIKNGFPGPKTFRDLRETAPSVFFDIFLIGTKFPFMQSFMSIYFLVLNIQTIKNGFLGPKSHNKNLQP